MSRAYEGSHAINWTICKPYNTRRKDGGWLASWMKMCANKTCVAMKKSSKADDIPKINEVSPIHKANTAHPCNKFFKFFIFPLSFTSV